MADNTTLNTGSGGDVIASDDIAGVKHQRVKVEWGADGSATDTSTGAASLPVQGAAAAAAAVAGNPVLNAGSDGTAVRTLLTDTGGNQYIRPAQGQTWVVQTGATAHVAAARTSLLDLFNAAGSGVVLRVLCVYIIPALAAVTGVGQTYELIRTSAVGTGGSAATPNPHDSSNTALPAQVTARTKPTGGATTSLTWLLVNGSSEETNPYAAMASQLNHVPQNRRAQPLVLREGQGLKIDQTTNSSVGNVNVVVVFESSAT